MLLPLIYSTMVFIPAAAVFASGPFEPLFNGENLDGWVSFDNTYGTGNDIEEYYKVANGELVILDIPESNENKAFGYLSTINDYADYHLRFEYQWGEKKYAPRADALRDRGVLYHLLGNDQIWDARLNGGALTAGRIAFQAERGTIRYRNIEIRKLNSSTPRILLFSETRGFRHNSIPPALDSLEKLATAAGMEVDRASDSANVFTDSNLAGYDAVVWVMTTGNVLDDNEQAAFQHYILSGGGYAGIHAASDTEYNWPWYGDLVGAWFARHPAIQAALQNVEDRTHPSTEHLGLIWTRTDEWYDFRNNPRSKVNVLLSLDESTYSGGKMGGDHPIAWYHEFYGGRSWYTGGGHTVSSYAEEDFRAHLLGGIRYAAGIDGVDAGAGNPVNPIDHVDPVVPSPGVPEDALDRSNWVVTASQSQNGKGLGSAIDGDSNTRWSTGAAQASGMYFQIDLGSVTDIDGIVLDSGPKATDYPRGYKVQVSDDGVNFSSTIAGGTPAGRTTTIEFPAVATRYFRIVQTGVDGFYWWSIHEINVSAAADLLSDGASSPLDRTGWSATASSQSGADQPANVFDGDSESRWSTGTEQAPGQWFLIDLGEVTSVDRLVLATTAAQPLDYPRAYEVTVSDDGVSFSDPVASGVGSATTDIELGDTTTRYLRIELTGSDVFRWWSISEAVIYGKQ